MKHNMGLGNRKGKILLGVICLILLSAPSVVAQKNGEFFLKQLKEAKQKGTDSLWYWFDQLTENTSAEKRTVLEAGRLSLASGLVKYNEKSLADSVFQKIDSAALPSSSEQIDYVILKARLLQTKGKEKEALTYLYQNMDKASKIQLAEIYMQIAFLLRSSSDLENCTKFYRLAEKEAREANNIGLQVKANMQLCKVFNGWVLVDLDSSVFYGEKAMKIAKSANDKYWETHAASMAAAPIIRSGDLEKGKSLSLTALSNAHQHGLSELSVYYLLINLGFIYQDQKNYDSAWYYKEKAHELRAFGIDHYRLEYSILKSQGKYKKALQSLETYRTKYDSAKDNRHQTKVSNLQARFEARQKEQEVQSLSQQSAIQQLQISQQRITLYGLLLLILIISVMSYLLYQQRKQRDQQKRENLEQRLLRLQMNPHFIYNALASIQNFVLRKKPLEASSYLAKFSALMRQILEHSRKEYISLAEEVETVENYIKIQQLRYPQVNYSVDIDPAIDPDDTIVPPMFVQPFVENAFEHGLADKKDDAHISIRFQKTSSNLLQVSVSDNGKGFSQKENSSHKSLAIQIANERLNKYGRKLHRKLSVAINNLDKNGHDSQGTAVSLLMPYK
jgi:two-component sensor histidine kinase